MPYIQHCRGTKSSFAEGSGTSGDSSKIGRRADNRTACTDRAKLKKRSNISKPLDTLSGLSRLNQLCKGTLIQSHACVAKCMHARIDIILHEIGFCLPACLRNPPSAGDVRKLPQFRSSSLYTQLLPGPAKSYLRVRALKSQKHLSCCPSSSWRQIALQPRPVDGKVCGGVRICMHACMRPHYNAVKKRKPFCSFLSPPSFLPRVSRFWITSTPRQHNSNAPAKLA